MPTRIPPGAVVVGVDGSAHERWAIDWGASKAAAENRRLVLLNVHDPRTDGHLKREDQATRRSRRRADTRTARARFPDLDVACLFDHGDARSVLLRASGTAAHLVVGSRGRGPIASLLLGSVGSALAAHAGCPVTIVRPQHPGTVRRGILVGVDDEEDSHVVADHAFREASQRAVPLTVRHSRWDVLASTSGPHLLRDDQTPEDARLVVSEAIAGLRERYPDVPVTVEVARGLPERTLVAGSEYLDLLVVGRHHHNRLDRMGHSAVAAAVVERAHCPVLVVPLDLSGD